MRCSLPVLATCLIALFLFQARARLFEPQAVPPQLEADADTLALYEFRKADFALRKVADVTGKNAAGDVRGAWQFFPVEELQPALQGVGKTLIPEGKELSRVVFPSIKDFSSGAFSVDVYMRWERSGGNFLLAGGVTLGIQHGGPGELQLRVPVKGEGGIAAVEVFSSKDFYKEAPIPRQSDFYVYSLTFDGEKTFQILMDGRRIFAATISEGKAVAMTDAFALGDVEAWRRPVQGLEIAAARVSRGVRMYGVAASEKVFTKGGRGPLGFDAGTAQSPVQAGMIRLTSADTYTPERGYGWLGPVVGDYDEPQMADRYANTPEIGLKTGQYRFVDAVNRDGVVLAPGPIFRVDVPDGKYWVAVEVGHNRDTAIIETLKANGAVLGRKLATSQSSYLSQPNVRTGRGLVDATGGKGISIEVGVSDQSKIPVKEVVVIPYEPLPIVCERGELIWKGTGAAPAQLAAISAGLKTGDFAAAFSGAKSILDPLLRANALECVLGVPHMPTRDDVTIANDVRQLLLRVLREQPENASARWLFDSAERYRYTVIGYLQEPTDVIPGTRFDMWTRTPNQGLQLRPEDPGYWQARFLAAGGLWQQAVQGSALDMNGTSDSYLEKRSARLKGYDAPGGLFREVLAAYPDFRPAKIMLGEKLVEATTWQPPASAPEWASLQYQLLQRILFVIHYWVNERMNESGFLGGGIGDDVEVLRWWTPGVLLADDETTISGWNRMADGVWKSTGKSGYSAAMDDVEHSSEPTSDPLPMLALINAGTARAEEATKMVTATLPIFRDIWSQETPEGYRMFKGYHFNSKAVERPGDVPYNIRAVKPLLWAAMADPQNAELKNLMVAYARNWRDATMSEGDGKPCGIVPMMIKPDRVTFREPGAASWVSPGYAKYEYPAGNAGKVYDLMLAGWELSGDKSFLVPIQFGLEALGKVPANDLDPAKYPMGSFDWAVRAGITNIVIGGANYRLLTGDKSYDKLLLAHGPPHIRFLIAAEQAEGGALSDATLKPLIASLKKDLATMNTNPELRTTLIQSTDRIYVSGSLIVTAMATGVSTTAAGYTAPDEDLRGGEIVWPTFQITWRGTGGLVAALVTSAGSEKLEVLLYNFADSPKSLRPSVWRLKEGDYEMTLIETDKSGASTGREITRRSISITHAGQEIPFDLPSHINARLSLVRK